MTSAASAPRTSSSRTRSTAATGDLTQVFGNGSPEWNEGVADPQQAQTDFVGIAVHCSQSVTSVCAGNSHAKPDLLPDEPGGYSGFNALYGTKYVDPAVTGGQACVKDTSGNPITDPRGFCGFPGFDGMFASNTLGYVAQMQENGVPVTYGYISDAHDLHVPVLASDSYSSTAMGPGELAHDQQLKAYDDAFASFFTNLKQHGITRQNTLFVITVDEGDHFAGGIGDPRPAATGRSTTTPCSYVDAGLPQLSDQPDRRGQRQHQGHPPDRRADLRHPPDDAPTFYVTGQPPRTDTAVRKLERDVGALTSPDPYVRNGGNVVQTVPMTDSLADPVEEKALHMVNSDPSRTPTFTMFGNPDFFFSTSNPCTGVTMRAARIRVEPRGQAGRDREHVGRHGRPRREPQRRRLVDVDRPHEPPADDPVARRAQGRLHARTDACSSRASRLV